MTAIPPNVFITGMTVACPTEGPHLFSAHPSPTCLCGAVKVLPATTAGARIDDMSWPTR